MKYPILFLLLIPFGACNEKKESDWEEPHNTLKWDTNASRIGYTYVSSLGRFWCECCPVSDTLPKAKSQSLNVNIKVCYSPESKKYYLKIKSGKEFEYFEIPEKQANEVMRFFRLTLNEI